MKFVLDTNIILSALIKDGLARKIITGLNFEFFVPSFSLSEVTKYKNYVCDKSGISEKQFTSLLNKIFEYVEIVPQDYYAVRLSSARKLISDKKDAPFLACAFALDSGILSNDTHFKEQKKVKVFTMQEFIKKFLKRN
ncbi:MAG: PIN domain-containing protein [Nanoarchaeota archaeon]|nr:PIN domain-containing protein [Nanoarchaeota archaeon]MBU1501910.1 PIN domain-containing protein [Nanoarchaeota archaeon]MBU2459276.1 PIN domain-containing protein [Nanoarchaeota archaeon]